MKNKSYILIYFPIVLSFLVFSYKTAFTQNADMPEWELVKEQGPLKVYTRKSRDSGIKELRMTTIVKASIEDFATALNDADSYRVWVYRCESSRLVKKISDDELYYQVETDFPFPMSNRDIVAHTIQKFDDQGVFHSNTTSSPTMQPQKKGVVRIVLFETHWKVTPKGDGSLAVEYYSKVDPAGFIPQWVVNLGLVVGPVKTMERFKKFVEEKQYLK